MHNQNSNCSERFVEIRLTILIAVVSVFGTCFPDYLWSQEEWNATQSVQRIDLELDHSEELTCMFYQDEFQHIYAGTNLGNILVIDSKDYHISSRYHICDGQIESIDWLPGIGVVMGTWGHGVYVAVGRTDGGVVTPRRILAAPEEIGLPRFRVKIDKNKNYMLVYGGPPAEIKCIKYPQNETLYVTETSPEGIGVRPWIKTIQLINDARSDKNYMLTTCSNDNVLSIIKMHSGELLSRHAVGKDKSIWVLSEPVFVDDEGKWKCVAGGNEGGIYALSLSLPENELAEMEIDIIPLWEGTKPITCAESIDSRTVITLDMNGQLMLHDLITNKSNRITTLQPSRQADIISISRGGKVIYIVGMHSDLWIGSVGRGGAPSQGQSQNVGRIRGRESIRGGFDTRRQTGKRDRIVFDKDSSSR